MIAALFRQEILASGERGESRRVKRCVDRLSYPVTGVCELMCHLCSSTHAYIELFFVGSPFLPNIYSEAGIFCSVAFFGGSQSNTDFSL